MNTLKLKDFIKVVNKDTEIRISRTGWDNDTNSVYCKEVFLGLVKQVKGKSLLDSKVTQLEFFLDRWFVWVD